MTSLSAAIRNQLRPGSLLLSRAISSSSALKADRPGQPAGSQFDRTMAGGVRPQGPVAPSSDAARSTAAPDDDKPTKEDIIDGAKAGAVFGFWYGMIGGFIVEPSLQGAAAGTLLGTLGGAAFGAVKMLPYAHEYRKQVRSGHVTPPHDERRPKVPPKSDTTYWA